MDEATISGILEFWQKTGLYPFTPLEVNFAINFSWVVLSSIFRSSSDYRFSFSFLSFRLIIFLFSFIATFAIYLTSLFWLDFYEVTVGNILWWMPSMISIFLAEFSHFTVKFAKKKEEEEGTIAEEMMEKSSKELPVYFLILFFIILGIWLVMILKNRERFGF